MSDDILDNATEEAKALAAEALKRVASDIGVYADGLLASAPVPISGPPGSLDDALRRARDLNDRLARRLEAKDAAEALAREILLGSLRIAINAAAAAI